MVLFSVKGEVFGDQITIVLICLFQIFTEYLRDIVEAIGHECGAQQRIQAWAWGNVHSHHTSGI